MSELIKFSEQTELKHLIPVSKNKMMCENYFWNWSRNYGDWIRGSKIPKELKQVYNKRDKGLI